jgi:hypothetical protein
MTDRCLEGLDGEVQGPCDLYGSPGVVMAVNLEDNDEKGKTCIQKLTENPCREEVTKKTEKNEALKMETVCFSETFISTYKSTRRYSAEDQHQHFHHCENLKSHA